MRGERIHDCLFIQNGQWILVELDLQVFLHFEVGVASL